MDSPVNFADLETADLRSESSDDAEWVGAYFAYGGQGATDSTVIYFAVPPGKRLGRHTDTAEETQYFVGGRGELLLDSGPKPVKAGDVIVLTEGTLRPAQYGRRRPAGDRLLLRPEGGAALDR